MDKKRCSGFTCCWLHHWPTRAQFGRLIRFRGGGAVWEGDYRLARCQSDLNQCRTDLCPESNNRWTRARVNRGLFPSVEKQEEPFKVSISLIWVTSSSLWQRVVFLQGAAFTQKHVTRERTFDFNLLNLYFNEFIYIYFQSSETLVWCRCSVYN